MTRCYVPPMQAADLGTADSIAASLRLVLARDPVTGGLTRLSIFPPGSPGSPGKPGHFEYHSCEEESFVLRGRIDFGGHYAIGAGGYMNHPPYWVHPSPRPAPDQVTMLLTKLSAPVDYLDAPIPDGWDGTEFFIRDDPGVPRGKGITRLSWEDVPWGPVVWEGRPTDQEARTFWVNPRDGWTTWMLRLPPGWRGTGDPWEIGGAGDELFVLEGDLTTVHGGRTVQLTPGWYYCYPEVMCGGGESESSRHGLLAIRWTRATPYLSLPEPV